MFKRTPVFNACVLILLKTLNATLTAVAAVLVVRHARPARCAAGGDLSRAAPMIGRCLTSPKPRGGAKMNISGRRLAGKQQAAKSLILNPAGLRHGRAPQLCSLIFQVVLFAGPQVNKCDQQSAFPAEVFDKPHHRGQASRTVVDLRPPGPKFSAFGVVTTNLDLCPQ